jgi:hypothetical protein
VESLDELNALIDQRDAADDARRIGARARTAGPRPASMRIWAAARRAIRRAALFEWVLPPVAGLQFDGPSLGGLVPPRAFPVSFDGGAPACERRSRVGPVRLCRG